MTLQDIIKKKFLILDGAMGTMIQSYNLTESDFRGERFKDVPGIMKGNNDVLNLTRPDIIREIHQKYLAAGADIIETNTFSSQPISMSDYHIAEYSNEITKAGCKIAREIADEFTAIDSTKLPPLESNFIIALSFFLGKHHLTCISETFGSQENSF